MVRSFIKWVVGMAEGMQHQLRALACSQRARSHHLCSQLNMIVIRVTFEKLFRLATSQLANLRSAA